MTRLCIWPEGPDHDELLYWERTLGRSVDIYRERGGRGKLDTPLLKKPEDFLTRQGSFDLQSRVGVGADGTLAPVPFSEILAGQWDEAIEDYGHSIIDLVHLSSPTPHWLEFQSECNVVNTEQPGPPWEPDGVEALEYIVRFWRSREVRARYLKVGISVTASVFRTKKQNEYLLEPIMRDLVEFIGVDGYSHPATSVERSFQSMFDPMRAYAVEHAVPWAICECGTEDAPDDPMYKARWYTEAGAWLASLPQAQRPRWVCFTQDGEWRADTTVASLRAFQGMATTGVFR